MITIKEVVSKKDQKSFVKFPQKLYNNCYQFVPPFFSDEMDLFSPKKNPSYGDTKAKYFLAYKNGEIVGRIAGIISYPYNKIVGKKMMRFSRIDMIDDQEVSKSLLKAVEDFAVKEDCELVHGPLGFNDQDREGMVISGFEHRTTFTNAYNYDYYPVHMEEMGYEKEVDWLEFKLQVPKEVDPRIKSIAKQVLEKYELRDICDDMPVSKIIDERGQEFFDLLDSCYGHLHGYVPTSPKSREKTIKTIKMSLDKRFISMLVDKNDRIVGAGVALASIGEALNKCKGRLFPTGIFKILKSMKTPKILELALVAVADEYKNKGLQAVFIDKICSNAITAGITECETNSELETNVKVQRMWRGFDIENHRNRRCYVKHLKTNNAETVQKAEPIQKAEPEQKQELKKEA